jgi:hypothetical protein
MWSIYQLQIAEQHQRDMRNQADKWRLANSKQTNPPNRSIRRNKRKRQR